VSRALFGGVSILAVVLGAWILRAAPGSWSALALVVMGAISARLLLAETPDDVAPTSVVETTTPSPTSTDAAWRGEPEAVHPSAWRDAWDVDERGVGVRGRPQELRRDRGARGRLPRRP
jgi:hypothetical protein